jgi:hypothetical protein
MGRKGLDLNSLLEKIQQGASNMDYPVVLVDTSAIIDIQHAANQNKLGKRKETGVFTDAYQFLKELNKRALLLANPSVCEEVEEHAKKKINPHVYKIDPKVANLVCTDFKTNLLELWCNSILPIEVKDSIEMEKLKEDLEEGIRYAAHWTKLYCCQGNLKKQKERFSSVDENILVRAACLSQLSIFTGVLKRISPVGVLTSDEHVSCGIDYLKIEGGFYGLYTIKARS